uniref:Putative nicotinamide mononucleotide transporter n=1 Tax=viral metagenome TaxID=1070528 RepID=A0A6M3JGW9_9ZZZZ
MFIQIISWIATLLCIVAAIMNIYKHKTCFILWFVAAIIFIVVNISLVQWAQVFLFCFNASMSIFGFVKWHKERL